MNAPTQINTDGIFPKIHPGSTRAERQFAHKAKMEGKKFNRANGLCNPTHFSQTGMSYNQMKRFYGVTSIARANRHTGEPHENRREIARRLRQREGVGS